MFREDYLCKERIISAGALSGLPDLISRHAPGKSILIVCDDATYVAAGQQIFVQLLGQNREVKAYSLGRNPKAKIEHVDELVREEAGGDVIMLAVGTGTVNDVTKLAAHRLNTPYICVPTGASMNGFTSATSSLFVDARKHSFMAAPPCAVLVDMDVIAAAPKRLSRSGLGDTLCRTTVETDMLLSNALLGTPYPREAFDAMRVYEPELIANAAKLKEANVPYLTLLMQALLDAGDWMARTESSSVASQGEHMIAHTLEMLFGTELSCYHGEVIAVTSTTMNELQNKLLLGTPVLKPIARDERQFERIFGKKMGEKLSKAYQNKLLTPERCAEINQRMTTEWTEIRAQLSSVMVRERTISTAFTHANIGSKPKDIRVNEDRYNSAIAYAFMTRERFTFLDLATMMGRRV